MGVGRRQSRRRSMSQHGHFTGGAGQRRNPRMVDFTAPAWTKQGHMISAVVGC
jgi:hypothetical protein